MSKVAELKREIRKELETWHGVEGGIDEEGINKIMSLIDQFVQKQEITEKQVTEYLRERSMTAIDSALMYRENLDNKIVIEKPTVPQFIADSDL